jgi:hypothetical protein
MAMAVERSSQIEKENVKLFVKMREIEMSQMSLLDERNLRQS